VAVACQRAQCSSMAEKIRIMCPLSYRIYTNLLQRRMIIRKRRSTARLVTVTWGVTAKVGSWSLLTLFNDEYIVTYNSWFTALVVIYSGSTTPGNCAVGPLVQLLSQLPRIKVLKMSLFSILIDVDRILPSGIQTQGPGEL
jgi:hypothetical protein